MHLCRLAVWHSSITKHIRVWPTPDRPHPQEATQHSRLFGDRPGTRRAEQPSRRDVTLVQGDATISMDLNRDQPKPPASSGPTMPHEPVIHTEFTNIVDLHTGEHRAWMSWRNMPILGGAFSGSGIERRFYGPNHKEVAGVFEHNRIVGAFVAKR